ncbi:MAG: acyltransferase family protein, partial [Sphingobium sp.]
LLWIVVSFALGLVWPPDQNGLGAWSVVASSLNLGFGLGIMTAAMLARPSVAPPWLWVLLGGGLLFGLGMMEWILGHHTDHSVSVLGALGDVGYLVASAVLIYGLAKAEEHWTLPFPALWKLLGGASYLIYLIHQPLLSVVMRVLNRLPALSPEMAFVLSAIVAVAVAVALHWTVERWILRRLQSFFALRAASAANGPA